MRNWIEKFTPKSPLGQRMLMLAVVVTVGIAAFYWGRRQQTALGSPQDEQPGLGGLKSKSDFNRRIVAYLYKDIPVTREELGEYLIARFGAERLEFMVNRKIVEIECSKNKIFVTDQEVEDRFQQDLKSFGKLPLTQQDFVNNVLRRFNKTLYEWKEDVIRPKLMMEKLVKSQVKVTEQDVRDGFEARFGPKVQCRMIVLQKDSYVVQKVWENARKSPENFLEEAGKQFVPNLAQTKGEVPAIHKHFGDKLIEETAFRLRPKEVSEPLKMQDGTWVILLCEKHIPADLAVRYEQVWMQVHREVEELKVAQKMPEVFAKLRERAMPQLMLENAVLHVTRLESPTGGTLSAFENAPTSRPLPPPTNVPAPVPTPLTPPEGIAPTPPPSGPLPPLKDVPPPAPAPKASAPTGSTGVQATPPQSTLKDFTLPKIDAPVEKK